MIVYRICKKKEIDMILNEKNFYNIGKTYEINEKVNTHQYKNNQKYIHFFKNKDSIFYLNITQDMFICTYDIPLYLLVKHYGTGFYLDRFNFTNLEIVKEYAIENELIDFNYLLKIERLVEYIDIENYMYDDISSKIETIYINTQVINELSNQVECNNLLNLYHILMNSNVKESISTNIDYLTTLIPEIKSMIGFEHKHPHHHLDVWNHTLYALSLSEKDFDLRLALLLHDIGKPFCFSEVNGIRHFFNHPYVSSEISKTILNRLGFNEQYINKICYLIRLHDTPITKKDTNKENDLLWTRYLMQECDALAHNPDKLEKRKKYLEITKILILKK